MILSINPQNPQKRLIARVCESLDKGDLIAYPTDTFYGIGCDLMNKKGIQLIHKLKNRPLKQPFSVICDGLKEISRYAQVTNYAYKTMKRCLPGPYTFIFEASTEVPKIMLRKRRTIGVRMPDNPIALALLRELGEPLLSTSIRNPEDEFVNDPEEIGLSLGSGVDMVVDGGVLLPVPSTVVDLSGAEPVLVRDGKGEVDVLELF